MNFVLVPSNEEGAFLTSLITQFPAITDEVMDEDYAGLIHLQVSCLARYANSLIANGRLDELRRVFDFFHDTVEQVSYSIENALYVSFLEHLEMDGSSPNEQLARQLLKSQYLEAWQKLRS